MGTAAARGSKVWYTVAGGVLSDVYEPTIDNTDVSTLQYVVTDGATFTDLQTRDMSYTVAADPTGMSCTVTSTDARHGFQLVTTYITDPASDTVLMRTTLPLTITAPASGATLATASTTVTGTTKAGSAVTIATADTTTGAPASVTSVTAAADGSFSATVPVSFGSNVITVTATAVKGAGEAGGGKSTGYGQVTVTNEGGGASVVDVTDPTGDDNGPGTYQYPGSTDFVAGSFDLTRFQVLSDGTFAYLRVTLRTLTPTFGVLDGAQLLDAYVHVPGASPTSTQAAFASRNYAIAAPGAWSQRVEVQGFAAPVWQDAAGKTVGAPLVLPNASDKTITIALPEAQFGTPATGWGFSVVLTGQDGFSSDQARAFTATPGDFTFGVCAPGGTAPVCSADPATVPKAVDVITPPGVSQATELDPTAGPVAVQPVLVS